MRAPAVPRLPLRPLASTIYLSAAGAAAAAAGLSLATAVTPSARTLVEFVLLTAAAAGSQLLTVRTGRSQGVHTAAAFVVAGAILLPPPLVVAMVVIQHVPEWVKERYPWVIQSFNIANFTLGACGAWLAAHAIAAHPVGAGTSELRAAVAGAAAVAVFVSVNHVLLALMLRTARGLRPRETGLFSAETLGFDLSLSTFGVALAALSLSNPWLVPALLAPLALAQRFFGVVGKLRDTEERYQTLFDAAPIGMVVRDLEGAVVETNRALRELLGGGEEVEPRSLLTPEEAHRERELHDELVGGARERYASEQRYRMGTDAEVFAHTEVALVHDAGRRARFVLSMIQDITSQKRLEEELAQAQKMEAIGRLAGGVAHDFNNLLTAISGYAEFAQQRLRKGDDEIRGDLAEIVKAADRAHQLTRQLLAFGRKQIMESQVLSLNDVVGDADTMLRRLIGENIEIVTAYGSGLGRVFADPGQLHQVIVNLVVNARDEMPRGGTLTIETANRTISPREARRRGGEYRAGSFVTLAVRDTGHGMDAATKARLFEPFFTRKEVGRGTGLGLATVYGIVNQSGGFLEVESEPGLGAAFTVFLPSLGAAAASALPPAEPSREPTASGSESILLVEDDEAVRRFTEAVLSDAGYRVVAASDGVAAREQARHDRFDLLLTDVIMPKVSGTELAAELRLPAVFMSGYPGELVARHGLLGRGTRLVQKPFSAAELRCQVRATLDEAAQPARGAAAGAAAVSMPLAGVGSR
ncbi:MAG TPA: ATP-binding protein [Gaiellaceae bacterium]|nr:ATP-binding protein [Gaiellaceae bacterium]